MMPTLTEKLMKSITQRLRKPNPSITNSLVHTLFRRNHRNPNSNPIRTIASSPYKYTNLESVPKERVDCVVKGAGVLGIAVARELSLKHGREVLVIESGPTFGTGISSRNSEVIHAGIYYPSKSLKVQICSFNQICSFWTSQSAFLIRLLTLVEEDAKLRHFFCVNGRELLYRYCKEHEIPHKQIGKLIVATVSSEIPKLNALLTRGIENGVDGLRLMEEYEAMKLEPELQCVKALLSPASGIIDTHSLMLSLVGEAESQGTIFSYNTSVIGGHREATQIQLHISESSTLKSWDAVTPLHPELILIPRLVVNSAGLSAPTLTRRFNGLDSRAIPTSYYARGCYFSLSNAKTPPFSHLIYPIPEDGGLGVHVTLDLIGQVKFGPDVERIDGIDDILSFLNLFDYSVCKDRSKQFYPEIRKYYPNLKDGSLEPGYAGIRPKLSGLKQVPADFVVQGEDTHGITGLVNLFGIESPGLTSSIAIAEHVAAKLIKTLRPSSFQHQN